MSLSHVSYLKQTQQMSTKVEEKLLDAGPHQFVTETCSSCRSFSPSMEEMPFQPPSSVSMYRQTEPHNPPTSTGTFPPHLHHCIRFFFFFPDMYPPCSASHCHYFSPFPAFSRGKNNGWENPRSRGEQLWTDCYRNQQKPSGFASCLCLFNGNFGSNTS